MSMTLDLILVILALALAVGYLVVRKIRNTRNLTRDWSTGRAESCGNCPVITIKAKKPQG
jgi:hypothetical protein